MIKINVSDEKLLDELTLVLKLFFDSEEIENLRLQLKLRGYNLGISGILSTFMVDGKYFKGKIIYNEDVIGDSHMAEALNSELATGIYF